MRRELSEEDEFGIGAVESDPMEVETSTSVKDHPDFAFLSVATLRELMERKDDDAQSALWLQTLPVEPDASQWTFLQVLIRPDRAWEVIQELVATVCIGHGMLLAEETPSTVLFRKKVGQDSMAHGMMDAATYQNLYVAIGVLPSKLRVLHIGYHVSNEQKLLGGVKTSHFSSVSSDRMKALNRSMDNLVAALQSTLTSQFLTASYLYMTTPENTVEPAGLSGDAIELDRGYVSDVRKTFLREMKANMRDLCIPLEEYAHQEEYACALLLNLLDPLIKKHGIDINAGHHETKNAAGARSSELTESSTGPDQNVQTNAAAPSANTGETVDASRDRAVSNGKMYGEVITEMVQALWAKHKHDCESKVKQKIDEKQKQVSARVQGVQRLRARALDSIINHPEAAVTTLKPATPGTRDDVLLYDGTCVVNNTPVRLNVTYGFIIFRSMVPLFARTTIVPFSDVVHVGQSSVLGIRVVSVDLTSEHAKGLTIATGIEVDLQYQLLVEILESHKRQGRVPARRPSSAPALAQSSQVTSPDLETLIGAQEEEEEKEGDADDEDHAHQQETLQQLIDEPETK